MRQRETDGSYLLRLEIGERLPGALEDFCREHALPAATVHGLGALADVTLGYFDPASKEYRRTVLEGSWELLSLVANVTTQDGALFAHAHVVLSGPDCVARGGHLFEGTVSVTAELRVWPIDRAVQRAVDARTGLPLWDL
jgi:predicted DNA-binding protein with PD1-like motif